MGKPVPKKHYSIAEYLALEEISLEKLEYHKGEIFAMAGGTINHSLLSANAITSLSNAISSNKESCKTFTSDAKIAISEDKFVFADTFVVCGKIDSFTEMPQAAKNPILIVEVLLDSTARYDREGKFRAYQNLADSIDLKSIDVKISVGEVYLNFETTHF